MADVLNIILGLAIVLVALAIVVGMLVWPPRRPHVERKDDSHHRDGGAASRS